MSSKTSPRRAAKVQDQQAMWQWRKAQAEADILLAEANRDDKAARAARSHLITLGLYRPFKLES